MYFVFSAVSVITILYWFSFCWNKSRSCVINTAKRKGVWDFPASLVEKDRFHLQNHIAPLKRIQAQTKQTSRTKLISTKKGPKFGWKWKLPTYQRPYRCSNLVCPVALKTERESTNVVALQIPAASCRSSQEAADATHETFWHSQKCEKWNKAPIKEKL